ncbi:MAG: PEGA domain-containing protein [Defluviitaleaceae bacterium]|nr:PEGA domain-containing protein [Defluviitaleaceae bacterium]
MSDNLYDSRRMPRMLEKDGVVYVPSGEARAAGAAANAAEGSAPETRAPRHTPPAPKTKMKPQKSQLTLFYIVTLVIGVIICVAVFGIVLNHFTSNAPQISAPAQPPHLAGADASPGITAAQGASLTGVVSEITLSDSRVRVMDADTGQTVVLNVSPETIILNRNRAEISAASLNPGNIVDVRYDSATSNANSIQISPGGWEHRMVRSVHISPDRRSINIGASSYSYDDSTIVIYRGHRFDIERIDPIDIVTISGIRSRALFVEVNRSHGTVSFLNYGDVRGGTVEINTSIFRQLADSTEIRLLEGAHRIVVRGDNIEPMVREIVLANGELFEIDLAAAQYRTGVLTINIGVSSYVLEIDGVEHSRAEPIILALDEEYTISVTSEGHVPFLQVIRMTEPDQVLDIELTELVEMGMIVISSTPPGASVSINGSLIGDAPISHLAPFGTHSIVVRHEGYDNWTMQLELNQARQEYQIVMTPVSFMPNLTPPAGGQPANPFQSPQTTPVPFPGGLPAPLPTPMPFPTPAPLTPAPNPTPEPLADPPDEPEQYTQAQAAEQSAIPQPGAAPNTNNIMNFSQIDEFAN